MELSVEGRQQERLIIRYMMLTNRQQLEAISMAERRLREQGHLGAQAAHSIMKGKSRSI